MNENGKTFWDFISVYFNKGIFATVLIALIFLVAWLILHPEIAEKWNVQISTYMAACIPKKRKKAFEKRLNLTIAAAKRNFAKEVPSFFVKFLPYQLKIEWVSEDDSIETVLRNNQVIIYVPNYKEEAQQAIGVLHNYCSAGFAEKAKLYMTDDTKRAADLIVTKKLVQHSGPLIFDYFNREYLPEKMKMDPRFNTVYFNLSKIDNDGLFLPVLINEIDKFASKVYPHDSSPVIEKTICELVEFMFKIATKEAGQLVENKFCKNNINIRIILAISDLQNNTDAPISVAENDIKKKTVETVYVLATGSKRLYAKEIAEKIAKRNPQLVFDPIETQYKRYSKRITGTDSVCYEINVR